MMSSELLSDGRAMVVTPSSVVAIYDRIGDPVAYATAMAEASEVICGAPRGTGMVIALTAAQLGITILEVERRYHFIQGKPSHKTDWLLAEFRMSYGGDYEVVERSPTRAAAVFIDSKGRRHDCEFTKEELDASRWPWVDWKLPPEKRQYKDNYGTPIDRRNMLWVRMVSDALRFVCPELIAGVYTPEEVMDMTPQQRLQPPANDRHEPPALEGEVVAASSRGDSSIDADGVVHRPAQEAIPAASAPADPASPGTISERHVERCGQLFTLLGVPHEKQQQILADRNAQVVRNLSEKDATDLIDRLEAKARDAGLEAPSGK